MKYNTLVRDKIPSEGGEPVARILEPAVFPYFAAKKLDEVVAEFHLNSSVEELIDIVDIALTLAETMGVSNAEFETRRLAKREAMGTFCGRVLLEEG